ncbi:hypothetical protein [Marinobacter sp. NFXS9]|uniref:hypothetical protein n=1 Tax=Marinobacter sp. NFXS9 TaxID=2818433 RepID=UPI0032DFBEF5
MLSARMKRLKQRLEPILGRIIQRFSRTSYRWNDSSIEPIGPLAGFPGGACVLPRAVVFFSRIDLGDLPVRERNSALRLELEQQAPFDAVNGWVIWSDGQACVWYWPEDLGSQAEDAAGKIGVGLTYVPEGALWPALAPGDYRWIDDRGSGLVVVQYQDPRHGLFEKRYTRAASRDEIAAWLHRHKANVNPEALVAQGAPELSGVSGRGLHARGSSLETRVFPLTTCLLGFFVLVYIFAIVFASVQSQAAQQQSLRMKSGVSDVLELRQTSSSLKSGNDLLASYRSPSQVAVAADLADRIDMHGGRLVRWTYRKNQLEVSWEPEGDMPESTSLITAVEAAPWSRDVQAQERSDTLMEMKMKVIDAPGAVEDGADD